MRTAAPPSVGTNPPQSSSLQNTIHRALQPSEEPGTNEGRAENDHISVLIVEDNLVNQKLLDKHLSRMGCLTTCANNGQEALDVIKQSAWGTPGGKRLEIVLMDIEVIRAVCMSVQANQLSLSRQMPVMSGLEAIQEIRQLQQAGFLHPTIPVLAVTANARPEQIADVSCQRHDLRRRV